MGGGSGVVNVKRKAFTVGSGIIDCDIVAVKIQGCNPIEEELNGPAGEVRRYSNDFRKRSSDAKQ